MSHKKQIFQEIKKLEFHLNINIQKTKIMASGPITSWEIDGETVETVAVFILGGSKNTALLYFLLFVSRFLILIDY